MRRSAIGIITLFTLVVLVSSACLGAEPPAPPGSAQVLAPTVLETCTGKLSTLQSDDPVTNPQDIAIESLFAKPLSKGGCACKCSEGCCFDFCYTDNCRFLLFC